MVITSFIYANAQLWQMGGGVADTVYCLSPNWVGYGYVVAPTLLVMSSQESVYSDYQGRAGFSSASGRSQSPTLANVRSYTLANVRSCLLPPANCVMPCLLPPPKKLTNSSTGFGCRPHPPLFLLSGLLRFS